VALSISSALHYKDSMTGKTVRPHCSQAPMTTFCQCCILFASLCRLSRVTQRSIATGTIRLTPSSVAFLQDQVHAFSPDQPLRQRDIDR